MDVRFTKQRIMVENPLDSFLTSMKLSALETKPNSEGEVYMNIFYDNGSYSILMFRMRVNINDGRDVYMKFYYKDPGRNPVMYAYASAKLTSQIPGCTVPIVDIYQREIVNFWDKISAS